LRHYYVSEKSTQSDSLINETVVENFMQIDLRLTDKYTKMCFPEHDACSNSVYKPIKLLWQYK